MSAGNQSGGGLSAQTLLVASVSSAVAAIVIGQIWRPGAILGAAMTPVIVALTSELLRKPAQTVSAVRARPRDRTRERPRERAGTSPPPAPAPPGEDRFGIWSEADRPPRRDRRRRNLRLALVTGLVAFVIGAVVLTTGELVLGGAVGGGERTTVFGGRERDRGDARDEREQDRPADDGDDAQRTPGTTGEEPEPTTTTPTTTTTTPTTPTTPTTTTPTTPTTPTTTSPAPRAVPGTPAPPG